jgi:hypothetical protein
MLEDGKEGGATDLRRRWAERLERRRRRRRRRKKREKNEDEEKN